MSRVLVLALRAALVGLAAGVFAAQLLTPMLASSVGSPHWEVRHLVVPYSVAGIVALFLVQIALIALWRLLTLTSAERIFDGGAIRWVNGLVGSAAGAVALPCIVMTHLLFVVGVGGPGVVLALCACFIGGAALVLVLIVLRSLLASATRDRRELAHVI
ncbi:DUF2975 domain-containing protein [Zhihengliuella halotolerans]|uniref:DUF2975 family protein n=1 Tax=Zhihengliuella halotolerans TaxID=370736 RepID=A0A4Q8AGG2_9MICC|nr:DUF2975 domain-containing protein [Zhihengliuella halotolerans]RZU63460.1 DUF2975 family protein [Zhihengliuella halotolerans]